MRPLQSFIYCCFVVFVSCSRPPITNLKDSIQNTLAKQTGEFAVAFRDLSTGDEILINEQAYFHAASTMKTPVMIEVFKQAKEGQLNLNDSLLIKTTFNSLVDSTFTLGPDDDSEKDLYALEGEKSTISDLVFRMIVFSSNLSTNLLIEKIGAERVTQTMRGIGAEKIEVLRGVEDGKAFRAGLNNRVTAFDLMLIFSKMANRELVSPEACDQMIDILFHQHFNTVIPALLPPDVKVAHKTGSITGLHHDSGIVFLPDGRKYVLVILSNGLKDTPAAVNAMAAVSRLIYDYQMAAR